MEGEWLTEGRIDFERLSVHFTCTRLHKRQCRPAPRRKSPSLLQGNTKSPTGTIWIRVWCIFLPIYYISGCVLVITEYMYLQVGHSQTLLVIRRAPYPSSMGCVFQPL